MRLIVKRIVFLFIFMVILFVSENDQSAVISPNVIFSDAGVRHLSPPLMSGNIEDTILTDMKKLKVVFEANLNSMARRGSFDDILSWGIKSIREEVVYNPSNMQFFFSKRTVLSDGSYAVMCRVWEEDNDIPRTYFAIFSPKRDETGWFSAKIYTRNEYYVYRDVTTENKIDKDNVRMLMDEAWSEAGEDIKRPFTDVAQEAFQKINSYEVMRRSDRVAMSGKEYFRVFYSQVFGANNYEGVIKFMEWVADNETGITPDFRKSVLMEPAFLELYFTARLMDGRSPRITRLVRRTFIDLYADRLFGHYQGHRTLQEIFGGGWDDAANSLKNHAVNNALGFIHYGRMKSKHETVMGIIEDLIEFSINERDAVLSLKNISKEEIARNSRLKEMVTDESGVIIKSRETLNAALKEAEASGAFISFNEMIQDPYRSRLEIDLAALMEEVKIEKMKADEIERTSKKSEIKKAAGFSKEAGLIIPTHPERRYTLIMTSEFFTGRELKQHKEEYRDRFDIESVSSEDNDQFVEKVILSAYGKEARTVALVPSSLNEEQLGKLASCGIKFIRADTYTLLKARTEKGKDRNSFQLNTYASMLLVRKIDEATPEDSSIYRSLEFYVKSLFSLGEGVKAGDYIRALAANEVAVLVRGVLSYLPAKPYRIPEYDTIAVTLMSA